VTERITALLEAEDCPIKSVKDLDAAIAAEKKKLAKEIKNDPDGGGRIPANFEGVVKSLLDTHTNSGRYFILSQVI
jgi:hypothetical protein